MPKSLPIMPDRVFAEGDVNIKSIPTFVYKSEMKDVRDEFSNIELINMYRDMAYIRYFEEMMMSLRDTQQFQGVHYLYNGPAHLSIGQEPVSVGQAYCLDEDDMIYGTHRAHGEIIARGMRAIETYGDEKLLKIMHEYHDGEIYEITKDDSKSIKEQAIDFFFYGVIAELFGKSTGVQKGLGNSMHMFFMPFGIYPNNGIVGASAPLATGGGLYKRVRNERGISVANLGDGSLGTGPVWESMNFAAMDQLNTLFEENHNGGLPVLFNVINNQYAMGGQPHGETMAYREPARMAAGVNPEVMNAERVNGFNIFAVIDATRRHKGLLENKKGPSLLEIVTYRYSGHSMVDSDSYRTSDEWEAWKDLDPVPNYKNQLIAEGVATLEDIDKIKQKALNVIVRAMSMAASDEISPRMNFRKHEDAVSRYIFSNQRIERFGSDEPVTVIPYEENPQVKRLNRKIRFAYDENGKKVSALKSFSLRDAIFESALQAFYRDPSLVAYGEENRDWGGSFGVYRGMTESLPYYRFFNAPISESAIIGSAVGYGMCGGRALVELMYCDFLGRAGDEVFNQLAKWQGMSAGNFKLPVVIRVSVGAMYGPQHSQDWSSFTAHIPGLKVVFPATPYDAKGLLNSALTGSDPVIFFESQKLYEHAEYFHEGGVPTEYYEIPIGEPDIKRVGNDVTILTIGATLYQAIEAADELKEKYNINAEVIDARSVVPFDYDKVIESVKKTGKIILLSDANERGSILHTMASKINEFAFKYLDAPVIVVGAKNWITPPYDIQSEYFPQAQWILDAINEHLIVLKGHSPVMNFTKLHRINTEKAGI